MDNDGFKALVQERSRTKTTKEIAREAVEEEFRRRKQKSGRKRGRGGDNSSDSEAGHDSDQEDDKPNNEEQKHGKHGNKRGRLLTSTNDNEQRSTVKQKYRDRAKERREGKNVDYQSTTDVRTAVATSVAGGDEPEASETKMDEVTMSKYLGGDENHTHLVKGLDVALARKVKSEMIHEQEGAKNDLDDVFLEARQQYQKQSLLSSRYLPITGAADAAAFLQRIVAKTKIGASTSHIVSTELGKDILNYLERRYLKNIEPRKKVETSPAGYAIQRSTLTFATQADPQNRARSWEAPQQYQIAKDSHFKDVDSESLMTPIDRSLLQRIQATFESANNKTCQSAKQRNGNQKKKKKDKTGNNNQRISSDGPANKGGISNFTDLAGDKSDDDNDDIFKDIDEYVPSYLSKKNKPGENDNENDACPKKPKDNQKSSVFSGLLTTSSQGMNMKVGRGKRVNTGAIVQKKAMLSSKTKQGRSVIDRDVFGARVHSKERKHGAAGGISVSSYDGGYGEEMDVDFDGRLNEDGTGDDKKKKKDNGTQETTVAAMEYGKRGKNNDSNNES